MVNCYNSHRKLKQIPRALFIPLVCIGGFVPPNLSSNSSTRKKHLCQRAVHIESSSFIIMANISLLPSGDDWYLHIKKGHEVQESQVPLASYSSLKVLSSPILNFILQLMPSKQFQIPFWSHTYILSSDSTTHQLYEFV